MKRVIAMRHAHAADSDDDFSRPLTPEGRLAAAEAAKALVRRGARLDLILCSKALRARQTAEIVRDELGGAIPFEEDARIYMASKSSLVSRLEQLPDEVACVLLVAHNPSVSELATRLLGAQQAFRPADFAECALDVARWRDIG